MSDTEKVCKTCGRIITDSDNKTGLCPKCQKTGNSIVGAVVLIAGVKMLGPKIVKAAIKNVKKLLNRGDYFDRKGI